MYKKVIFIFLIIISTIAIIYLKNNNDKSRSDRERNIQRKGTNPVSSEKRRFTKQTKRETQKSLTSGPIEKKESVESAYDRNNEIGNKERVVVIRNKADKGENTIKYKSGRVPIMEAGNYVKNNNGIR